MKNMIRVAAGFAAMTVLAACGKQAEQAAPAAPAAGALTVLESMTGSIIPASNKIWELAGNLYDDDGKLDAKRLSDAQWTEIKDAAATMGATAKTLAAATGIKVAAEGVKIQSEGTEGATTAAQVQAKIDADPQGFGEHATQLASISDEIVAAATARDAAKTDDAQARLTDVCGTCHSKYWYSEQAAK